MVCDKKSEGLIYSWDVVQHVTSVVFWRNKCAETVGSCLSVYMFFRILFVRGDEFRMRYGHHIC